MPKYSVVGTDAASTSLTTIVGFNARTTTQLRRLKHFGVIISFSDAPGDLTVLMRGQRYTADGTPGTSPTPTPHDPADAAACGIGNVAPSVEPTYTAGEIWLEQSVHQRNTLVYFAPECPFITPAADEDGLGWQADASSGTPQALITMQAEE